MQKICLLLTLAASFSAVSPHAFAALETSSIIASNMVLQRNCEAPIWGWDTPGTSVTVTFRDGQKIATAGSDGRWMVRIPTGAAGGPFDLKIQGTSELELKNILVGEVWIAGGQSNMWWHLGSCLNADAEVKDSNYPIRIWDANTSENQGGWRAEKPQKTVKAEWKISAPDVAGDFSGTPFFFARELQKKLGVPVGIVHVGVPGAEIEPFLSGDLLKENMPQTVEMWERRRRLYEEDKAKQEVVMKDWQTRADEAKKNQQPEPEKPPGLPDPASGPTPANFFNGMLLPAAPFAARGFLWWQGESNASDWMQYRVLFPALIEEWRELWGLNNAPFIFCELHAWLNPQKKPVEEDSWPNLRDAQRAALALPGTFEVSNIDILTPKESLFTIHPTNKQQAGHRLFLAAMANVYGEKETVWSGPVFKSASFANGTATVSFDHVGGGLTAKGGAELKGFALAGSDHKWYWADAKITGKKIELKSKDVPQPLAVRYAWANNPTGNLINKDGLPAFPFRSDSWILGKHGKAE